jgi:mannose-1-phosphate guanylyltransferase
LVVVETADAVLVCHRDAVHDIKKLTGKLPKELL